MAVAVRDDGLTYLPAWQLRERSPAKFNRAWLVRFTKVVNVSAALISIGRFHSSLNEWVIVISSCPG